MPSKTEVYLPPRPAHGEWTGTAGGERGGLYVDSAPRQEKLSLLT